MTDEKPVLQINEKFYDPETISENGQKIIEDISKIDGAIAQHQINLSIANIARGTLLETLDKEAVENFTEVEAPEVEAPEVEAPEVEAPEVEAPEDANS